MFPTMEKLSITLTSELAALVRNKVAAGGYASNSEVVREALRMLRERDSLKAHKLEWLRDKVEGSISDPRRSRDADDIFATLEARFGKA